MTPAANAPVPNREFLLRCDRSALVTWLAPGAEAELPLGVGDSLRDLAAPGEPFDVAALLSTLEGGAPVRFEVQSLWRGEPARLTCTALQGSEGSIEVTGWVRPVSLEDADELLGALSDRLADTRRALHSTQRELEQQTALVEGAAREIDESNRGIIALHNELQDQTETLQRSLEVRKRIVANVSHELRTPLSAILGLSRLLLNNAQSAMSAEERKEVGFIRSSADELNTMVSDLLDMAKVEAGKMGLRADRFTLADLFAGLRGTLKPLLAEESLTQLFFEDGADAAAELDTDRSKLTQILRNLVSNALKFTERGEVRVRANRSTDGYVEFRVSDTGIGISEEHLDRVFDEFAQIDGPLQRKLKGTGLGLPLSKQFAELLGGSLSVASTFGEGSTFTLRIPALHPEVQELEALKTRNAADHSDRAPVLVVEDDRKTIFIYDKYLAMDGFRVVPARSIAEARAVLKTLRPSAIVLDIMLEGESSWGFLGELKADPATRDIPVLVVTISTKEEKARALGADEFWLKPMDQTRLLRKLRSIARADGVGVRVLLIDDEETARYILRRHLQGTPYEILEASTGDEGVRLAREKMPHVIFLDFRLGDQTAFDVLDVLKADPSTRNIPVIINTAEILESEDRARLSKVVETVMSKTELTKELAIHRIRDALHKVRAGK